jgi:curved DNA-binding protein CbpA
MNRKIETYYEVLRIDKKASATEILAAYHAAKGAFSREALAGYGVFSQAEVEACLKRIEEAYQTLSDPGKRNSYDKLIEAASETLTKEASASASTSPAGLPQPLTGLVLKAYREQLHLSLEEVFRITRIPIRYLKAIEEGVVKEMPARVYLQGFVKNLAHVYKLPPNEAAKLFLEHFDKNLTNSATS